EPGERLQHRLVGVRLHRVTDHRLHVAEGFRKHAIVPLQRRGRIAIERRPDATRERGQVDPLGVQFAVAIVEMMHLARQRSRETATRASINEEESSYSKRWIAGSSPAMTGLVKDRIENDPFPAAGRGPRSLVLRIWVEQAERVGCRRRRLRSCAGLGW